MLGGINQTIKEFVAGNKGVHQKGNKEKETKFERKWIRKKKQAHERRGSEEGGVGWRLGDIPLSLFINTV